MFKIHQERSLLVRFKLHLQFHLNKQMVETWM